MLGKALINAAAGNAAAAGEATYVEDVFSTYLYTGNGSTQTITNDIDLDGEGGMVWFKARNQTGNNAVFDTIRGGTKFLKTNGTDGDTTRSNLINSFNSDGFTLGNGDIYGITNYSSSYNFASWTFRKAPGFFDVVTWTGDGNTSQTISHNLGCDVGTIVLKGTSNISAWAVWHKTFNSNEVILMNSTGAKETATGFYNGTAPTSTQFTVGEFMNVLGYTYVAYLFADGDDADAQIFGTDGDQAVVKCGSYTGTGVAGNEINLGFEPQFLLFKNASSANNWYIMDTMRGFTATGSIDNYLYANLDNTEGGASFIYPTPTGFGITSTGSGANSSGDTFIYIAIRRGPMKTPESGTEVFNIGYEENGPYSVGFPVDSALFKWRDGSQDWYWKDRIRGDSRVLNTDSTNAESNTGTTDWDLQNQIADNTFFVGDYYMQYLFRRAPGFFDVVAFELGNSTNREVKHNLSTTPEMLWWKKRSGSSNWAVFHKDLGQSKYLSLQNTAAEATISNIWGTSSFSSTAFYLNETQFGSSGDDCIAYLFASLDGISKVGSYTGNGTSQTIDCGFSNGARFVLVKRTSGTADWLVWDTERGINASANDPRLRLNTADAEDTGFDQIDPDSSGFIIKGSVLNSNASGETYIYLAIA